MKSKLGINSISDKSLLVVVLILMVTLVLPLTVNAAKETDKSDVVRKVAKDWITIGQKQYDRGMYVDAEKSLLMAMDYTEYLSPEENKKLKVLLDNTHLAVQERSVVAAHLEKAKQLIAQGKLDQARIDLEKIRDSQALTPDERKLIDDSLTKIAQQQSTPRTEIIKRFNESVKLFETNQLEQARKGFLEVSRSGIMVSYNGKTAEDYLAQIDQMLLKQAQSKIAGEVTPTPELPLETKPQAAPVVPGPNEPNVTSSAPVTPAAPDNKKNLLQSYASAVVNDAVIKVQEEISQGNFDKARKSIEETMNVLRQNRANLGEELFNQYIGDLEEMTKQIIDAEQAKAAAGTTTQTQQQANDAMRIQQAEKIETLAKQAVEKINQKQYEEALQILNDLLTIKKSMEESQAVK